MFKEIKDEQWEVLVGAYRNGWQISESKLRDAGPEYHLAAIKLAEEGLLENWGSYFSVFEAYRIKLLEEIVERKNNDK